MIKKIFLIFNFFLYLSSSPLLAGPNDHIKPRQHPDNTCSKHPGLRGCKSGQFDLNGTGSDKCFKHPSLKECQEKDDGKKPQKEHCDDLEGTSKLDCLERNQLLESNPADAAS